MSTLFTGSEIYNMKEDQLLHYNCYKKSMERFIGYVTYNDLDYLIWDKGISGLFKAFRRVLRRIVALTVFDNFIMATVVANTIQMGLEGAVVENEAMK